MEKKKKINPEKILDKIEKEEQYQKTQSKKLNHSTVHNDTQRKKIDNSIQQSEERVAKLKEKLSTVDKKLLHEITLKRMLA
ncbi:MAG: hypothetical protein AABY15_03325 [Nanoarchaeota archaeon]